MRDDQEIIIVAGLPRSGTSLCMRMLEAGGIPTLTDGVRAADDDNPNGYYELEAVKRTLDDPSWLVTASGNAVKMVYRLVYDLPKNYRYAIVLMRRDLDEVLASQRVMLKRNSTEDAHDDEELKRLFALELEAFQAWLTAQAHIRALEVDFNQLVQNAGPVVRQVNAFLGGTLQEGPMRRVVDPTLYRNRKNVAAEP